MGHSFRFCEAIPFVTTPFIVIVNDDVTWPSAILNWRLEPFEDKEMGDEHDFIVSLGTGTPRARGRPSMSVSGPLRLWKDGAVPRLCRLF